MRTLVLDSGECWVAAGDDQEIYAKFVAASLSELGSMQPDDCVAELVARLVLGVCLDVCEHRPSGYSPGAQLAIKRKRGEPQANSFVVTRNVEVDCRPAVRDYIARRETSLSDRSPAATQRMHRGHWQLQVHGPHNSLRKRTFHRPYWQGHEDAPVALRDHVLDKAR